MRKHAGRPGRSKWKRVMDVCVKCTRRAWLDDNRRCKQCRRAIAETAQ